MSGGLIVVKRLFLVLLEYGGTLPFTMIPTFSPINATLFAHLSAMLAIHLPLGVLSGVVVRRLSCKHLLRFVSGSPATSSLLVQVAAALLADRKLLQLWGADGGDFLGGLSVPWVLSRLIAFAAGARLGEALQPVGLTGGIACGKSTVAAMLRRGGRVTVIDLDGISHDVLVPGRWLSGYDAVVKDFGRDVLAPPPSPSDPTPTDGGDGRPRIDRRKLGDVVFKAKAQRRRLNRITHPRIVIIMLWRILREGLWPTDRRTRVVCVDAPLLYEAGMRPLFAITVVVGCSSFLQLMRLSRRDKDLTGDQARTRIGSQMDVEKKRKLADVVIWNDGSVEELEEKVERAREEIEGRSRAVGGIRFSALVLLVGLARLLAAL